MVSVKGVVVNQRVTAEPAASECISVHQCVCLGAIPFAFHLSGYLRGC